MNRLLCHYVLKQNGNGHVPYLWNTPKLQNSVFLENYPEPQL